MEILTHLAGLTNLPLSSAQMRLWLVAQQDLSNPAYNLHLTYHFTGEVNYDVLCKSVDVLFHRQYAMFSTFKQKDGNPYIEIVKRETELGFVDFSGLAAGETDERILSFLGDDFRQSFDLENGPLYRLYLVKENNESYYFHATIHHLIFDGFSRRLFVKELSEIYSQLKDSGTVNLEQPEFQSFDYPEQETTLLNDEERIRTENFWKNNLKDCPAGIRLPYDYPRKSVTTGLGYRDSFEISKDCTTRLKKIAEKEGTSLFTTVTSLLGILFQKYSCGNDICIGIPVSNRRHFPQSDKIFGLFLNTCVVRLSVDEKKNFNDHLKSAKDVVRNAILNSKLSFSEVVESVNPERIPGINPLFQVSLSWLNDFTIPMQFGNLKGERVTLPYGVSPFDITFYMWEEGDNLKGDIEYNTDVFRKDTIARLKKNLTCLINSVVDSPDKHLSDISAISKEELKKLAEFNKTETPVLDCPVHEFFEKQAIDHPQKTAVICGNSVLTYSELNEKANRLANHLISLGVSSGDAVGISLERSTEMVISVLAVLKTGCCYLPMDPAFPDDRLTYMFEDSGAKVLISQSTFSERFSHSLKAQIVYVDSDNEKIRSNNITKPGLKINTSSPAYIIYTSGSTGRPKGVTVHHKAVVNLIESMSVKPGMKESDITLAVVTLSFDMSVFELFVTLSRGATLVIASSQEVTDGTALINLIEKNNVTVIQATPSFWSILLSGGWKGKKDLKALCGGEALTYSLIHEMLPRVGKFWNCYGPTETTVYSSCIQVTDENAQVLIGKPINNTTIHILDNDNMPLPIGVAGEVSIGGAGVTKGYRNRPDLTHEKFVMTSWGEMVYKTGDQGRYLDDGNIELFGRLDNQIKLRGFRIEPGEIETLLSKLAGVREAVVKIHRFNESDERLVAFLNAETDFKLTKEEINTALTKNLPTYMIPSFFQISDGFPRLPNGKINKTALLYETKESDKKQEIDFDSLTESQKKLLSVWEFILKAHTVNVTDNFFDAGGNSLLGIRLINQIKDEFGIMLTFRELVTNATIIQLGNFIDHQTDEKGKSVELVHSKELTNLPLTRNQKRLWLISQLQPDVPLYIIRSTYKFNGLLDRKIFEKSIDILFHRHNVVFSVIKEVNSEPLCDIVPTDVAISFIDYTILSEKEKSVKINDLINEEARKRFDLEKGPLYRLYLIKTADDEYYFHMSIHHIIFDGWSQGVFVNDLSEIYNSLLSGKAASLKDLEFQQYDFAQWESRQEDNPESVAFWEENLKGCSSVLNFPYDSPRNELTKGMGGLETIKLSSGLSNDLRRISKEEGASLFTTMLSCFGLLMNKYSGEDDINLGLPLAFRPHTKLEKIFGMFVNTVVVRLRYDRGVTLRELIKQSDNVAMNAISHQDLPFESVVEIVKPERVSNSNPLFQVAFAWQNNLSVPINLTGVKSETIKGEERAATFDLTIALWENGDIIEGEIEYNRDILKTETIIRLKNHFLGLLNTLVSDINLPINKVQIISDEEINLINKINETATDYPKDKTIAEIFEDNAKLLSDNIAISFKGVSYTYKQLNERANQIARTLRASGVGKNTPVGVYSDKSLEMVIGILGILKSGGCYAPIDPEYPEQRASFIVKDSGLKVILLQDKYMGIPVEGVQKLNLNSETSYDSNNKNLQIINKPEDLAYILYTSGTTGTPKGTPIPQRGVVRLVCKTNIFDITPDDNFLLSGTIVFDATVLEMWGALLNGASLYIIEKETLLNSDALEEEIVKNKITVIATTSALFTHIVESKITIYSKLKYLVVGGDILSPVHATRLKNSYPNIVLINGYGPTENSCMSTYFVVDKDFDRSIPIGKPNSNSTVYIFDRDMNYQPIGIPGELYVGGDGLSSGYLNRDDLNKICFIEHPYLPDVRIYKTGDLVKWSSDWNIEFLGRVDNQMKIRGFRVELEEIESVLSELEDVIEAVIKPVKVEEGDYRLVAFLNVPEAFDKNTDEILAKLRSKLPAYMIPSAFNFMHGFPKTINGKTDRKALKVDLNDLQKRESIDISLLSPTAKIIHRIWCQILKTDVDSVTDNFFDIGGNSLIGLRLINTLREEFGITLTFKELVANSSINQLASIIDTRKNGSENVIELVHLTQTTNLPLTSNQRRLWLISKMDPDIPSHIIPSTYKLSGPLDTKIFQKSIETLFERHHIVFSVIKNKEGEPYCEIVRKGVDISYSDYTGLPEEEKSKRVKEILESDSRKPFDLEKGPLYRLYLIKTASEEYYLHISLHHIIFDGWSWSVFVNDLSEIYSSLLNGKEVTLPALEYQEYDYAQWESSLEGTERESKSIEFWTDYLSGCSPVLNFPYDYQRREHPTNRGSHEIIQLTKELTEKIKRLSKSEGASLFITLLSAFGIQLQKYSGEDDLNIGLWVANRPHSKLENIFGMFVNTIVARLQSSTGQTFKEMLHQTSESVMNAITHQDLSFDKVVDIVNPDRTSNVNPLFQIVFAWQDNLDMPIKLEGIRSEEISEKERTTAFDLTLSLLEKDGTIQGVLEYNLDILKSSTVVRMRDNYVHLLEELVENPEQTLAEFSIVSESDKKQLAEFNNTKVSVPEYLLHNLFEEQVILYPQKRAVTSGDTGLAYRELDEKANQLAGHLLSLGVKGGDTIGISLERTAEMVVSVLGVLKAGCCYLPMDPSFPDDRLSYMFEDSGSKVLISESSLKEKFRYLSTQIVLVDTDKEKISRHSVKKSETTISNQSLAYIIYTSGSTGKPKGVKVHHQAIVNFIKSMSERPGMSGEDRLLAVTTLSFDISLLEVFLPLSNGAEVVVAGYEDVIDGKKLKSLLERHDITILQATPATWNLLLAEGWQGKKNMMSLCGGEAIPATLVKDLLPKVSSLWDMYGPTETTVWSTCYQITDADAPIIVGRPIYNTTVHILDKNNELLPIGVIGEVGIGGMGVTKGYHNRPELTAEKFIQFGDEGIIYKTGDQGRYLDDGNIELLGRIDNQIKLRGFRIEPGEIETLLAGIPNVREAVVKVHKFAESDERLVAFLNAGSEYKHSNEKVIATLANNLPSYMIPSFYQISDGFPRLPNGKINKKALVFEMKTNEEQQKIDLESLTLTQGKLLTIWQSILKTSNISLSESFFNIGGNSLLAISLMNKVKEQLGFVLTFKNIITYPSITLLADFIDKSENRQEAIKLVHQTQTTNLPLTASQKRIWLISKQEPDSPAYIIPVSYKLSGPLNTDLFRDSLNILFTRHHVLFSVFKEKNSEPYCSIIPRKPDIELIDFSDTSTDIANEKLIDFIDNDSVKVFDLENGPLYRLYLVKTGLNEYCFHMSVHHIIFDGWSTKVFINDLNKIYNGLLRNSKYDLDNLYFQQYDFAYWEANSEEQHDEKAIDFWSRYLRDINPVLNFPYDNPRRANPTGLGGHEDFKIPVDISKKLIGLSESENVSLFGTMLSMYSILLHKYSGEDDICIGIPVAYRPHSMLEEIIGMFVNTIVVRSKIDTEETVKKTIYGINKNLVSALEYPYFPFEKVVDIIKPERLVNVNPIFQAGFVWQDNLGVPIQFEGIESSRVKGRNGTSVFDLGFYMWEKDNCLEGVIEYNKDILERETVISLRDNFIYLLKLIVEKPGNIVSDLSILSENEKQRLNEFNKTDVPVRNCLIQELFEKAMSENPDSIAVISGDSELTYKELDERSNQLAGYLISLDVNPGEIVGICLERTNEMIISVLAVLKAGGCYLPLDPSFPEDRLGYMIEDSETRILISQSSLKEKIKSFRVSSEVIVDEHNADISAFPLTRPLVKTTPDLPAYIIYTSGSTGRPKGVPVRHQAVVNLIESMSVTPGMSKKDKLLAVVTLSFDMSVYEIFITLSNGATLVIADSQDVTDGNAIADLINKHDISVIQATPSFWHILLSSGWKGKKTLKALCGGEALTPVLIRQMLPKVGEFWNCYGPTEITVYATCTRVTDPDERINIGKPINNTKAYILDSSNRVLPVGVIGEVAIGGTGVSKGYRNRPELTAEKFITTESEGIIYKTGDIGRFLNDGNIELFGRADNQIKLRGFRIEPGEIETLLTKMPHITEAVVKIHRFGDNDDRLVAFLNVDGEYSLSTEEIQGALSENVPSYMIPSFIQATKGFPRLPNGKINKKDLVFKMTPQEAEHKFEFGSLNRTQLSLLWIWMDILKVSTINPLQSFFSVGGNSLLAISMMNKIKEQLGVMLTFKDIIKNPTVELLSYFIDKHEGGNEELKLIHHTETTNLPLTANQKRLWIISKQDPCSPSYIIPISYKLSGPLNTDLFINSLEALFSRHYVLFSVFKEYESEPYCNITSGSINVEIIDFSHLTNSNEVLVDFIDNDCVKAFDLENGPLYRLYLIKTGEQEYCFHMSVHHIVFDGWSSKIFIADLNRIYNSLLKNKKPDLKDLEFQQYDYAYWESNFMEQPDQKAIDFWSNYLNGIKPVLDFPYDNPRETSPSGLGGHESFKVPEDISKRIIRLSENENISLFGTMLSVYMLLLSKYSGESDICIGIPVTYRPHSNLEEIVGMFVNTVAVRAVIESSEPVRKTIHAINESLTDALEYQYFPFGNVVDIVNPERSLNVNPIFQAGFIWQDNMSIPIQLDGIQSSKFKGRKGTSVFDLGFYMWEENNCLECTIEYNNDILERETVSRLRDNFVYLLKLIGDNPDNTVLELSILSESEKTILQKFNKTDVPVRGSLIQEFFEKAAADRPDSIAVISGTTKISYKELEERSNQLASYLGSIGVKPGEIVGIFLDRSPEMIISVLAVLKTGCCYLPLDPSFPEERLGFMVEDSETRVLISQSSLKGKMNSFKVSSVVFVDNDREKIGTKPVKKPVVNATPEFSAYIIYTSGSTGKPKGVPVRHRSVVNLIESMSVTPGMSKKDKLLAVVTLSFDMSVYEIFITLSNGATLVIADSQDVTDGNAIADLINKHDISVIQATPSFWHILLSSGWKGKKTLKALCGGEALTPGLIRQMLPKVGEFWNCYGPTEITVYATCIRVTNPDERISIGKPINNTKAYILDSNNRVLPVGVIGEVAIGGTGVSKGYRNRPELTAEKFITTESEGIIYKTGDIGRFLNDGNIELFGRADNQIKLRGFRIEPGEIETLLTKMPHITEAVVKIHRFGDNDDRLVAFLNVDGEYSLSTEEIQGALSENVPSYMIPSFIQATNGFPRLPNGKINKKDLELKIDKTNDNSIEDFETLTDTQKKLMLIWQDVLKVKAMRLSDSFFNIGGNSLLVISLINKIKEQTGVLLNFRDVITHPSIALISGLIDHNSKGQNESISLVHLTERTHLPLTKNQKRLWLITKLQPDVPLYTIRMSYKFSGALDCDLFRKSLEILFERHYIVFSQIKEANFEPYCDIVPAKVDVRFLDYSGLTESEKPDTIINTLNDDSHIIFDLTNGPLYRICLIKASEEESYFQISIHHIIFDGWSQGVMIRDLNEIYNSLLTGKETNLENIEFQQFDYAQWEKGIDYLKTNNASAEFWRENLKGCSPMLNFPFDFPRKENPSGIGKVETISLSKTLSDKLRNISKEENSSLFATLLSVFGVQMSKYSGEDDLNIGLPVAFRPHSKLENIFGMFVNTVVVRLMYDKDVTLREIVSMTNEAAMNAIAHQDLPFENVVEIANPERSSSANPLFQVGFVWQNNLGKAFELGGVTAEPVKTGDRSPIFDITLYMWENDDLLKGEIEYNTDLLKEETAIRLKENYIHLLETVVEKPDLTLSNLSIVSADDRKELSELAGKEHAVPECLIQDFFEGQATSKSKKAAVISGDTVLTYKELDEKANQIANYLISLGVRGGDVVGICLERSAMMIASALGILKTGCCYLPMDPSFPDDRIKYMFEDSGAKVLISQSSLKSKFLHFSDAHIVLIDTDEEKIARSSADKPVLHLSNMSPAYIIYTSGSTGTPKGVMVHHKSVVNLIESMSVTPGIDENDKVLAVVTLSFDMSVFEIFVSLSSGATVVVAGSHDITDGAALIKIIEKQQITVIQATPSFWNILLSAGWKGKKDLKALCGGEAMTYSLIRQMLPKTGEFWNCYGPTETTVYSTCMQVTDENAPILIGKPLNNTAIHIIDKYNNLLPLGVTGEVAIGGMGVTTGYHNKPELTNEKFIRFEDGNIVYKTGDQGKLLEDGSVELFGRIDNQIKLRGFRIEPGEIETLLARLPNITEAVVKLHSFGKNDERLVAFIVVDEKFHLTKEEIVNSLSIHLPQYMIPSFFQDYTDFPRLPNGKVNKKALVFNEETLKTKTVEEEKRTPTEEIIFQIWKEELKTENISVKDNFFFLGGNSLLAISVFSKIEAAFKMDLGLRIFFDRPHIKDIAEHIDMKKHKTSQSKQDKKEDNAKSKIVGGEI